MNSFYTEEELKTLGLKSYGKNVYISKKSSIYGANNISIGDNVRIDDFCILSGKIIIGNYIHISAGAYLYGGDAGILINDFAGISARALIYAISDDFSGEFLVGSMISDNYRKVISKKVIIEKYVQIGAGSIVLPGCIIQEGVAIGAGSMVNRNLNEWNIYIGTPAKKLKKRQKKIILLEKEFLNEMEKANGEI
jgi:galactoside O-acetyltransferase